jgi:hypothetical protein
MSTRKTREPFEVFLDSSELGGLEQIGTLYKQERTDLPAPFA